MKRNRILSIVIFTAALVLGINCSAENKADAPVFGIVIHGGAGNMYREKMPIERQKAYEAKLKEALDEGYKILENGGSSLDAVEAAIRIMEDCPLFNAGKGAVFTGEGVNELDASVMDGKSLNAGAVAGVKHIKNPISLARLVMDKSPHVMLTGSGAEAFAKQNGVETVPNKYFYTKRRWESLQRARKREKEKKMKEKFGTVGAVALDSQGNLSAGTSTGGMTNKKWGRVGDSPVIGAGTYANNRSCAVSATGHGEYFIRNVVAYDISALMEYKGLSLQKAAHLVIMEKLKSIKARGGIIAIDNKGNVALPFNTTGMHRGYKLSTGKSEIAIFKD